jgi:hypothetical protein
MNNKTQGNKNGTYTVKPPQTKTKPQQNQQKNK